jgi:hypothetical protein
MVVHAKSGGMADENGTKKIQMRIERLEVGKGGISEDLTALLEEVSVTAVVLFHASNNTLCLELISIQVCGLLYQISL